MPERTHLIDAFLSAAGWADAVRIMVAGDASNRRYERLTKDGGRSVILMDAPPEKGEDVQPFIDITAHLRNAGLSAPEIYARDTAHGFLLIEDLGDDLFARVMAADPSVEATLYDASVDVLVHLHGASIGGLAPYDADAMTPLAALAFDWYQRGTNGSVDTSGKAAFSTVFHAALAPLDASSPVLIQRDYHAENLIWLPDRQTYKRVGLLDYQDAMLGHPAYDLVSIAQDARRDVTPDIAKAMQDRYLSATGTDRAAFLTAYALLGVQRNMRILGVFARLSMAYGKPHYIDLIPRVWGHIQTNLAHPVLSDIAPLINAALPVPTPEILQKLKDQCATIPLR
ncbi:phosphotransferase [uncultured Tateyamaria sp.]|uniref:aminoglycoside phosphotransferase family protein n=1 Tax=uncultured Tateyamaria sp. TaxID=455651 RepID=UPI00262465AA|nr:phosphotransferase [uncultured Tateyamaria sp.]